MGKRRKQARLAVASTGRVELTDSDSKRSGRPERSPSPATAARLERAKKAQQSSQKYHKPTWRDEQEQGRIVDEGQAITSSSEDDDPGLVESFELVDDEAEEASEDEDSSEGEEGGHQRRRRGREGSDSDSDEQPTPRRAAKKSRRAKEIVLSSDDDDDEEEIIARTTPVASTSKSKPKTTSAAKENGGSPPKRKVLVFDSIEVSPPPPTKRRALAPNNKGTKANPASKPKPNTGKSRPARESAAQGTPEEERMSIALGHPQDSADESDEEQPVKGPGSSARKRSRVSSSSDESHRSATTDTSDGEVRDDLPLPASIAADNKRLKAKRETTLNNAALRSPRKTKNGKVRKVDTKRKLTALSQGVRDRRSEDEESDEEDFVVDDDDAIIYDTTTEEEEDQQPPPTSKKQKKKAAAKRKGKERAVVSEDEDEEEGRPVSKKKERGKGKSRKQVQRDLLATDSEDEQPTRSASKRKHGKKNGGRVVRSDNDDDDDDEEDEPVQRKKRRRRQHHRSSGSEEESNSDDGIDDGPEDLEILDEETVLDQKFRTLKTNESKFASLKAARDRRKASQKAIVLDSEDERPATQSRSQRAPTDSQPRFLGDPDHNSDEEDDSEESDSDGSGSGSGSDSSSSRRKARSDSEGSIDDFLAEDDENMEKEVEKYRADLQMKSQGMRYYYKTYIILLVYMIIDPDRDWRREDKELRTADEKVTQELEGFLSSLVGSSAWKPKFQHVIDTRPELTVDPLDADEAGGPCDVCTMGRARHASSLLTLFGPKYNRKTLQDLVSAEDSSAEEESDSEDENAGRKSRDKYYTFHSGGVCTMRAEFYHQLRHWAHSTRDRVADMLKPLRREIRELETDTMTKKKRKKARKQMTRLKHEEASRLIRILEDGREVEQLTDRLQKEIQQACSAFAKNG